MERKCQRQLCRSSIGISKPPSDEGASGHPHCCSLKEKPQRLLIGIGFGYFSGVEVARIV